MWGGFGEFVRKENLWWNLYSDNIEWSSTDICWYKIKASVKQIK